MAISFNNIRQFNVADGTAAQSANLYYVLASGPTYTGRSLLAAADMFTDTAVTGDYLLFTRRNGCSKPAGIRVDIATAMVTATGHTITWEYRKSDGTWAAFAGVTDGTTNFTVVGQNSVTWTVPTDWGTDATAINSMTGSIWFRARLTVNTTLSEGGRTSATPWDIYDYSVRVDANHQYDSGTASAGSTTTLTDATKGWATNVLMNRIIRIHTGTGAGTNLVIKSNTATVITFYDTPFTSTGTAELALDNTSQYVICANFEDLYQADVAGGWGVITKCGSHSYSFNCWLNFDAGAFGDINTNVEFVRDFYFYCTGASTNRYPQVFGWRLPAMYGADKGIWGNTIMSNRTCPMDNRGVGFSVSTEYTFTANNRFILRADIPDSGSYGFIRCWFFNYHRESISDTYDGWRSVTFPKSTTPRTEVRNLTVQAGYSGIEQPLAAFSGVRVIYSTAIGIYITSSNVSVANDFAITPMTNVNGNRFSSPIQFYALTVTGTVTNYSGTRSRPMGDVFGSTPNSGNALIQYTLRMIVTDEQGNLLPNAKVQISDSLTQNRKTYLSFDGVNDVVNVSNNATSNQLLGSTAFSVEAWVWNRTTGGGTLGRVVDKNGTLGYYLLNNTGSWTFNVKTSTGLKSSTGTTAVLGDWVHLVGVWDGTNIYLYVDGTAPAGVAAGGTTTDDDSAIGLTIGNNSGGIRGLDGYIRRVRIFRNKGLSSAEVITLWNNANYVQNQTCPVSGCTAEYNFTEGTGTTLTDTSGQSANGTLGATTAAPTWVDTNAADTSNAITTFTGTEGAYLNASALTDNTRYSASNQPASPTQLRVLVSKFKNMSSNAAIPARIEISGTDVNDFVITETIFFEEFRNGAFLTNQEFKTIATSGIYCRGMNATVTIDNLGVISPQTIKCENWRTMDDISLKLTDYNPIIIKVSRPGFEPVTLKQNMYEQKKMAIALKRSVLDLT